MKKWAFILLSVLLMLMMSGCNHKSDAELVDVEQFRCQDSIETVFEVLGEVDMDEMVYNYKYEALNLFGYEGDLCVYVREVDKRTIEYFSCWLRLNDSEYEEIIEYFSEKYGECEEYINWEGATVFSWSISEPDGKIGYANDEIGYDVISIRETDSSQLYVISFKDEWSSVLDTKYFEALEESKAPQNEWITVGSKEYAYDGVEMNISLLEDEQREFHFTISLKAEEKWKAAGIYTYAKIFVNTLNDQLEGKGFSSEVMVICNDDVISSVIPYVANEDNVELVDVGVWLIEGYQDENFDAEECEKLWEQMEDDIYYFLMGDEYLQYKNN